MRTGSDEMRRENQNTYFKFRNFSENHAIYDIKWTNMARARKAVHNIKRFVCIVYWLTKARETHSEYVILTAFPRQQKLTRTRLNVKFLFMSC
jgi:hypothetical protein